MGVVQKDMVGKRLKLLRFLVAVFLAAGMGSLGQASSNEAAVYKKELNWVNLHIKGQKAVAGINNPAIVTIEVPRTRKVAEGNMDRCAAKLCARCQVTTTDQASGEVRGPEPLKTLSTYRDTPNGPVFGMNLLPVTLGTVRLGDPVTLA